MKKILFFAMALVACALAFTSCDKNKVDSPVVGTWRYQTPPAPDSGWFGVYIFTFNGDGTFALYDYAYGPGADLSKPYDGFVWRGPYEINGDIITIHKEKYGMAKADGTEEYDDEWQSEDEKLKFSINGNIMHITRDYGTDYPWEADYTKQ